MYKSTLWIDDVVDAETGDLIQEGTPLSADKLNNMERGIVDAQVSAALMITAIGRSKEA